MSVFRKVFKALGLATGLFAVLMLIAGVVVVLRAPTADEMEIFVALGHRDSVRSVAFSPDGKHFATAGGGTARSRSGRPRPAGPCEPYT